MDKQDTQRIKHLSSQIYVALIANHLDDYAYGDDKMDWEAMAQTATHAAFMLIKQWRREFPEVPKIEYTDDLRKKIAALQDENVELKIEVEHLSKINKLNRKDAS